MSDLDLTEAVDAAARDIYESRRGYTEWPAWEEAEPWVKLSYRERVLPIVASTAPHIERAVRARIAADLLDVDRVEWALAGKDGGRFAARIAMGDVS